MKKALFILFASLPLFAAAQEPVEKEVKSEVGEVTVYLQNALENRKTTVDLLPGKTLLKFTNLSPYIDAKSVQARLYGDVTLLLVNYRTNYLVKPENSPEYKELDARLKAVNSKINTENAHLEVIDEDLNFLKDNRDLGGTQAVSIATLKEGSDYFTNRTTALKLKRLEREQTLQDLYRQRTELESQLNVSREKKSQSTGEVSVLVEAKKAVKVPVELSYLVSNASWYPSYDIRAERIGQPLEIVYKANIRQDSRSDWKNVKLRLSSYNPNVSGVAPELKTYFLDFNTRPPVYASSDVSSVSGRVTDEQGSPVVGVNVKVANTSIATVTDGDGQYSLTLPANNRKLEFSMIGYDKQTRFVSSNVVNVQLRELEMSLEEVAVGVQAKSVKMALQGRVAGLDIKNSTLKEKATMAALPEQEKITTPVSVDFEIKMPYTVLSDNKVVTVDMERLNLPADFQYIAVPKLSQNVFLTAGILDWEKYSFLEGEANVFFEGAYVGKTILDVSDASDTLNLSLGIDKKITLKREKVKDYVTKQLIGSKKVESREWKTTVRNTRTEAINLVLLEQVPVSTNADIEVTFDATPSPRTNPETGEIRWTEQIASGQNKVFDLKYSVKYPKNKRLIIE